MKHQAIKDYHPKAEQYRFSVKFILNPEHRIETLLRVVAGFAKTFYRASIDKHGLDIVNLNIYLSSEEILVDTKFNLGQNRTVTDNIELIENLHLLTFSIIEDPHKWIGR